MYLLQFQTGFFCFSCWFLGGLLLPLLAYLFAVPIIVPFKRVHPREPLNDAGDDGEGENDDVLVLRGVALFCVCVCCDFRGVHFLLSSVGSGFSFTLRIQKQSQCFTTTCVCPSSLTNLPGGEGVVCCCVWEEAWARAIICMPFPNVSADFDKTCFFALTSTQLHVCVVYFGG